MVGAARAFLSAAALAALAASKPITASVAIPPCSSWADVTRTYTTTPCLTRNAQLAADRSGALECVRRYADAEPAFGSADESWEEYAPTCIGIDRSQPHGAFFLVAEPRNALSSLTAFDTIACDQSMPWLHAPSTQLGVGSFAFHASGNPSPSTMYLMDYNGMKCATGALLERALRLTGTGPVHEIDGAVYNYTAVAERCASGTGRAVSECLSDTDATFAPNLHAALTDLGDQMPDFYFTVGALLTSMLGICLPRSAFDAIGAAMTALGIVSADALAAALSLEVVKTPDLSWRDWNPFDPHALCPNVPRAVGTFVTALRYQGEQPIGRREVHHAWHRLAGRTIHYGGVIVNEIERRLNE